MDATPRQPSPNAADTPGTRAWSKPVLVEYGHLAKLTRGPSGSKSEPIGSTQPPAMCL